MDSESIQYTGRVKYFNVAKGFGFIDPDNDPDRLPVFVHINAVRQSGLTSLRDGQSVKYYKATNPVTNKISAANIEILK